MRIRPKVRLVVLSVLLVTMYNTAWSESSSANSSQLARTPPMGWNSWNKFACNVSEGLIRETADAMVSTGMQAAGYQYVNIDDC